MGDVIGYARVSTDDQDLNEQCLRLTHAGASRVFTDKLSGLTDERPGFSALLDYARPGDTVAVVRLDRFSRSQSSLLVLIEDFKRRRIGFTSLEEQIDTRSAGGDLIFQAFEALAQLERPPTVNNSSHSLNKIDNNKSKYKRKNRHPSEDMHEPDGGSYRCPWIEDSITIHSDGNVSCGLDDPHAQRSFGNINYETIEQIFANQEFISLQNKLRLGYKCKACSLYAPLSINSDAHNKRDRLPSTIIVETTVRCNLRCPNDACIPNNDPNISTRDADDLEVEAFQNTILQLKDDLKKVYFFNYGDPFLHKNAVEMLTYLKNIIPSVEVVTSTNGIPLAKPLRAEKVIGANINHIVVTLSGIDQESYAAYHKNGRVDLALKGLRNLCDAKRNNNKSETKIIWRYLLFRWNDSREEVSRALALSKELGVDQFSLYLTHFPVESASFRFAPGSPNYKEFHEYIDLTHGYNAEIPQEDGFYKEELIENIGRIRWTSSECRIDVSNSCPFVKIYLAPIRTTLPDEGIKVIFHTPWSKLTYYLRESGFREIFIRVPLFFRFKSYSIGIEICEYWFPAQESGSADLRCLGLMFKVESNFRRGFIDQCKWLTKLPAEILNRNKEKGDSSIKAFESNKSYVSGGRFEAFSDNH